MRAVEGYDMNKGAFSTYAIYWIKQSIFRDIENKGRTIRVPSHMLTKKNRLKNVIEKLTHELEREPTEREISIKARLPVEEVKEILNITNEPVSLDIPLKQNEEGTTLGGTVADDKPTPEEEAESKIFIEDIKRLSRDCLDNLQYQILIMYLGIGVREHTLKEIADKLNYTSMQYIRTQKDNALNRLRRTRYVKEMYEEIEANTIYYKSIDYGNPRVIGGLPSSSVENIVLNREKKFQRAKKEYIENSYKSNI